MMRLVGLFNADARELVEMMYEFDRPFVMDSTKAQQTFGMAPTPGRRSSRDLATKRGQNCSCLIDLPCSRCRTMPETLCHRRGPSLPQSPAVMTGPIAAIPVLPLAPHRQWPRR